MFINYAGAVPPSHHLITLYHDVRAHMCLGFDFQLKLLPSMGMIFRKPRQPIE